MQPQQLTQQPILNAFVDGDAIMLVRRDPKGGVMYTRTRAEFTTYHRTSEIGAELLRQLKGSTNVKRITREDDTWTCIAWADDFIRRKARRWFHEHGVTSYEGDVDPIRFFITTTKTTIAKPKHCYLDIEADSSVPFADKEKARVFSWAISDDTGPIAKGLLDEDTDDDEERLHKEMWSVLERYDQVFAWYGGTIDPKKKDEGYDFPVLVARATRLGIDVDPRRWLWVDMLVLWRRMNQHSAESGEEKQSMALENIAQATLGEGKETTPDFVRERFGDRPLGAITRELWDAGGEFRNLLLEYNVKDTELLRKLEVKKGYVTLFQTLCEVCGVLGNTDGLNPMRQMDGFLLRLGRERGHRFPTKRYAENEEQFLGAYVMHPRSVPGKENAEDPEDVWTREQAAAWRKAHGLTNGILHNVHVCDFASLYPSIILTWNLSEETRAPKPKGWKEGDPIPAGMCRSPGTGAFFYTDKSGILPDALRELLRRRKYWSDLAASLPPGTPEWYDAMARSTAYKVAANSFYGVVGSPFSRYFDVVIAESVTQNGVWLLKLTIKEAEIRRMAGVYGDTDSAFVMGPSETGFRTFVKFMNDVVYPRALKEMGCVENHIKLAFEKTFDSLVFVSAKRYIGRYSQYKGTPAERECHGLYRRFKKDEGGFIWRDNANDKKANTVSKGEQCPTCGGIGVLSGKPEIKGLEYKRGDASKLARTLQGQVIDLLVGGLKLSDVAMTEELQHYSAAVVKMRDYVLNAKLPRNEVMISQSLSKPLKDYAKKSADDAEKKVAVPPHVMVARVLESRGQVMRERTRVEYVVVDGGVTPIRAIPADDYADECDRFYLWENKIFPPTQRLLESAFPDNDWTPLNNVRPPKARKGRGAVADTQLGFQLEPRSSTRVDVDDELAVPTFTSKPLVVRVPEAAGGGAIDRIKQALTEHPGARAVEIVIALDSGAEAILATPLRVSAGPRLKDAIERAIKGE